MSTADWKNKELNTLLMEKWGYKPQNKEFTIKKDDNIIFHIYH